MDDIVIRRAAVADIDEIRIVIEQCGPVLVNLIPYVYWVILHYHSDVCAVAAQNGKVLGVCLGILTSPGQYLLWQLGVVPELRGHKIAQKLLSHVFDLLKERKATLQFTLDRDNDVSIHVFDKVAKEMGGTIRKENEIPFILREYNEDLFTLVFEQ